MFIRPIQRYLAMPTVKTVVVSYDDYTHCPLAKGPTQAKRKSRCEVPEYHELLPLQPIIAANHGTLLFNRTYKAKVIRYAISAILAQCKVQPGQRIIVDYQNNPYVLVGEGAPVAAGERGIGSLAQPGEEFNVLSKIGESDLKWVRYIPMTKAILLDAVDSDYLVIALNQVERLKHTAPQIYVRRLLLEPGNAAVTAAVIVTGRAGDKKKPAPKKGAGQKRSLDKFLVPGGGKSTNGSNSDNKENIAPRTENIAPRADVPTVAPKKSGRVYEYVDSNKVSATIRATFGRRTPDALKPYTTRILSFAVGVCGSDFTRSVPWVNATTICKFVDLLWPGLCAAASVDPETDALVMCPRVIAERVIGRLWKMEQFKKLCSGPVQQSANFETLFKFLSTNTAISVFRRERLVTPEELYCLVRACNWTVFYWSDPERCPCAVNGGNYGFVQAKAGGKVQFDDKKPLPAP
ncbi:hypothetical protein T484DRAFT_1754966 [Baffinella frigidus]|nr:hypothetical protein T484DRAFT_1754966 [Cryptophyta sp. CCMP2293]